MSNIRIKRVSNIVYPKLDSFEEASKYISDYTQDFEINGEIVMVVDYDSGASKAYRIERTANVVEI